MVVTGDRGVGKTALVLRYAKGIFNFAYAATVGVEFYSKNKSHDNEAYTLQLWDTVAQFLCRPVSKLSNHWSNLSIAAPLASS